MYRLWSQHPPLRSPRSGPCCLSCRTHCHRASLKNLRCHFAARANQFVAAHHTRTSKASKDRRSDTDRGWSTDTDRQGDFDTGNNLGLDIPKCRRNIAVSIPWSADRQCPSAAARGFFGSCALLLRSLGRSNLSASNSQLPGSSGGPETVGVLRLHFLESQATGRSRDTHNCRWHRGDRRYMCCTCCMDKRCTYRTCRTDRPFAPLQDPDWPQGT